ncbi:serine hydrolase [Luteimonas sp. SJ-92]|uniref:Serine hydrolase n=1 Tax=Luteimonas salinisoli TaxID=2752307 RepID=A0A853JA69_9GAMM|nr:serine hydrolase domain-containing protein [Luteimonas salinisoli]NZA25672.1 serine hydrolase [Luteimonas salinisoli]
MSIRDSLPEAPSEWAPVTIRQLLNHTSGIADLTEALIPHFRSDHPAAMRDLLAALTPEQKALQSPPGQAYRYNNYGFELLAEAAARAAGQPFAEVGRGGVAGRPAVVRATLAGTRWSDAKAGRTALPPLRGERRFPGRPYFGRWIAQSLLPSGSRT